ncbi:hypothetical protein LTS12_028357, partial [Elasticomyces elasticus]
MKLSFLSTVLPFAAAAAVQGKHVVNQTTCGDNTYQYNGLAGYGYVPSNATDKYGDTLGGYGSSIAIDQSSWKKTGNGSYSGMVYALPDRGWNTNGTLNFQSRIHKLSISLRLEPDATPSNPSKPNLRIQYLDTILLYGPDGEPTAGLDADGSGHASYKGFPPLPVATYTGDGFGGPGAGGKRISVDSEGLALDPRDGAFWVSDEYGPYVYKFDKRGEMQLAIQPPQAFLPRRNGTISFSSGSPPIYAPKDTVNPEDTESGRDNNQGLEALTISADGKTLYTMIQSSLDQEGGPKKRHRQPVRLLEYDISGTTPQYKHEYAVLLPKYRDYTEKSSSKNAYSVAAQSEMHQLPTGDFLVLARDSGFGNGQTNTRSVYRHADVISIHGDKTTDLKGDKYDSATAAIASSKGVLDLDITP